MQPFQPPPLGFGPPQAPKKKVLPRTLRAILVLKGIGLLLTLAIAIMGYAAFSNLQPETPHFGTQAQDAHALANMALVVAMVSIIELIGVFGTYAFKRWGVFIVGGFTVLSALLHVKNGETYSAAFGLLTTAVLAYLIVPRWSEFD